MWKQHKETLIVKLTAELEYVLKIEVKGKREKKKGGGESLFADT